MEGEDITLEEFNELLSKAFNWGYLIAKYDPILFQSIEKSRTYNTAFAERFYYSAFIKGGIKFQLEKGGDKKTSHYHKEKSDHK